MKTTKIRKKNSCYLESNSDNNLIFSIGKVGKGSLAREYSFAVEAGTSQNNQFFVPPKKL